MDEVNVRDEGFTVLSEGVDPFVDLVFVHGIQGHPKNTWTYGEIGKEPTKPARGLGKLFSRKKQTEVGSNEESHPFWPKDLLAKDFSNARVLTYGYDSKVTKFFKGPVNQSGILAHGESLMRALEVQRRGCRQRPIIFLVHSLGGIILKQALSRSKNAMEEDQDLRDIYQSTYAIIFFGTPHRGSSYAQMGVLARDIAVAAGFDARDTLIRSLKPDAEMLSLLREEFARMLYDRAFKIYSFQEGQGFKGTYSLSRKIVDDDSSRLDDAREGRDFINANHIMMCRFRDKNDEGYNKVKGVVSKYMDEIQTRIAKVELDRYEQAQKLLAEEIAKEEARLDLERKLLVKEICWSLKTAHMNERVGEVTTAHTHTFDWVFENPQTGFVDWLHSNKTLFWITGKPGSGKSTLMKYLLNDSRTREALSEQGRPILSTPAFFFHARGVETEKSFDGLLRSIIFQLLSDVPRLVDSVADIYRPYSDENSACPWTFPQLEKALDNIRQQQIEGCICIFIDALDEYSGRSEDIARFVKRLAAPMDISDNQKLIIRVCASSRPWNAFTSLLNKTPSFTIQDWTEEDIRKFATDRLEGCNRDDTSSVVDEITNRAEGVFLWVALVLDELWQPLCDGKSMEDVRSLLSGLPTDLPKFYKRMMENIPKDDQHILMGMLELVLCSDYETGGIHFPLFCLAVELFQRDPLATEEVSLKPADDERRKREVERRIRACSGGLLEVAGSRVQFVHQTVKSFIGDAQNSFMLNGKSTQEMAVAGMERMMRLLILLITQMDSTPGWEGLEPFHMATTGFVEPTCPKSFPHFHVDPVLEFIVWGLMLECVFEKANSTIMHEFHAAIRIHCGDNWLDTWWSVVSPRQPTLTSRNRYVNGLLKPSSFLEFATQVELFSFSESEIKREISRNSEVSRSPKLLFYMLIGNVRSHWKDHPFVYHSPKQWQDFARFLLRSGFDPNIALEIEVGPDCGKLMNFGRSNSQSLEKIDKESDMDSSKEDTNEEGDEDEEEDNNEDEHNIISEYRDGAEHEGKVNNEDDHSIISKDRDEDADEEEGNNEDEHSIISIDQDLETPVNRRPITAIHLALAIACSSSIEDSDLVISHLEMLAILVEGGGNANVLSYKNHWSHREGDATERSAIHCLLSSLYDGAKPFHHSESKVNDTLSRCITTFLNYGADPNAVDSNGVSILELALPICPYALAELMLEKGAQVTPKLLSKSGKPLNHADGILNVSRWRRPECYTPAARVIACKYNTHWADLEEEQHDSEEQKSLQNTGNILSTVTGYLANLAGSVKRRR